jgi:hypothetical protein
MASGDIVVKDGLTWDQLRAQGVETVTGLEMEAATMARIASSRDNLPWGRRQGCHGLCRPSQE